MDISYLQEKSMEIRYFLEYQILFKKIRLLHSDDSNSCLGACKHTDSCSQYTLEQVS